MTKPHNTEDPTRSSAADAAGMAADYSARATYARGYEDGLRAAKEAEDAAAELDAVDAILSNYTEVKSELAAEKARADAAEQRVRELRDIVADAIVEVEAWEADAGVAEDMRAALASTTDIAGRWVSVAEYDKAVADSVHNAGLCIAENRERQKALAERDAAIAARDEAVAKLEALTAWADKAERAPGEIALHYRELLAAAERARDEVGIQLAAAQAEIARLRPVVEAARLVVPRWLGNDLGIRTLQPLNDAIRALDAVPGDALAPCLCAELSGRCPRHPVPPSPADASVQPSNVKGGE